MGTTPGDAREWVSFEDPNADRTWVFDVTFLTSPWTCIYGKGCPGVLTEPTPELVQGCCSYGAHLADKADAKRVEKAAKRLTPEVWQYHDRGRARGVLKTNKHGETVTRMTDGACIFLNRPGFATGPGCALHYAALSEGRDPLELKPEVCWQLPLRCEHQVGDDGHWTSTLSQWDRRHWGEGGQEFHWWCTESPDAFVGHQQVYVSMRNEIVAMVGEVVYGMLVAYLQDREQRMPRGVPLAHPALRR